MCGYELRVQPAEDRPDDAFVVEVLAAERRLSSSAASDGETGEKPHVLAPLEPGPVHDVADRLLEQLDPGSRIASDDRVPRWSYCHPSAAAGMNRVPHSRAWSR